RRLRELQKLYSGSAPPELANASHVKNYREGTLFIATENAATAAKLRQMAPTLLTRINKSEPEIREIRIGVQVAGRARNVRARTPKTALPADALNKLDALAQPVGDETLKSALTRLVQHQRRSRGKTQTG